MDRLSRVRLHGWTDRAVLAAAALSVAAGYSQFGATAALADIAAAFGQPAPGGSITAQVGLSATTLGLGLGVIRIASLASLPLSASADRFGRRRVLLVTAAAGLALTATSAASPTYWWFVAIYAAGRPLMSATNAVAGVVAAEETRASDRAKAIALLAAAYAVGAGATALVRAVGGDALGFRGLFALTLVPLAVVLTIFPFVHEPDRYSTLGRQQAAPRLGAIRADLRPRLWLLAGLTFAITFVTGPANTFVFAYAEGVLGLSRFATLALVVIGGAVGLPALLAGRWATDAIGRRATATIAQALVAVAGIITYAGGRTSLAIGYILSLVAGATFAPAAGALAAELFPTSGRGTAAGWVTVAGVLGATAGLAGFGLLADALGDFRPAALAIFLPVALTSALYLLLPETRGLELEESAPERGP